MKLNYLKKSKGYTIAEFIIAMGLTALLLTAMMVQFLALSKVAKREAVIDARDLKIYQVLSQASNKFVLRNSLTQPENADLRNCVNGGGPQPCQSYNGNTANFYPITLYEGPGLAVAGPGIWPHITSNPVWYNLMGAICVGGPPSCVMSIETAFRAQCPPPPGTITPSANCTTPAEFIQVVVKITHLGDVNLGILKYETMSWGVPIETAQIRGP